MANIEPRSFNSEQLGPEAQALLRAALSDGRVSASLTEEGPSGAGGLARYALLETLCSKGYLAYDGDAGFSDELELGFVLTAAGQAYVAERGA
jgi:hypothetical protein